MTAARNVETDHARAVAEAFRSHAGLVERVLRRAGVAERDLGDLRQEVFVVVHRRLAQFEGRSSLSTWLYRIALHVASDHRRRAYQRRERLAEHQHSDDGHDGGHGGQLAAGDELAANDPLASAEQQQLFAHVLHALEHLDADKREAFVLSELYELPMREVASRLGCPAKTAFSRTYAARRRILAELHKAGALGAFPLLSPLRALRGMKLGASTAHVALMPASALAPASWLAAGTAACAVVLVLAFTHGAPPVRGRALIALQPGLASAPSSAAGPITAAGTAVSAIAVSGVGTRNVAPRACAAVRVHAVRSAREPAPPPRAFAAAILATEPAPASSVAEAPGAPDDMQVVRSGALDLRPALSSPLAASLPEAPAAPARIRVRGPGDPADGVESALSASGRAQQESPIGSRRSRRIEARR